MQNLFETVKKAQMVVQVEAVRVQKELAAYGCLINYYSFSICFPEYTLLGFELLRKYI
jgi:hypothetical protein